MDKLREELEKTKLEKALGTEYVAELGNLTKLELEVKLLDLSKHEQALITTKNNDAALIEAKEVVRSLNEPYREQLKGVKQRSRFIALLLDEKFC